MGCERKRTEKKSFIIFTIQMRWIELILCIMYVSLISASDFTERKKHQFTKKNI